MQPSHPEAARATKFLTALAAREDSQIEYALLAGWLLQMGGQWTFALLTPDLNWRTRH